MRIDDEGKIQNLPLSSSHLGAEHIAEPDNVRDSVGRMLGAFQELRDHVAEITDLSAEEWNSSPIGTFIKDMEATLRGELYKIEDNGKQGKAAFNVRTIDSLVGYMGDLTRIVQRPSFLLSTQKGKLQTLNKFAERFAREYKETQRIQDHYMNVGIVLALDEYRQRHGDFEGAKGMVSAAVEKDILGALKRRFGEL